ncbi:selenocysteine-specific translation elongation factor [Geoalkalibacter sp.]|uniref:selenocysteine-specific translation elongation factor n=1 Tax=Geoalkalibacter sp. TaxID=3041440 RepID=UPI00272EB4C3|nr:selenocysteine-specific translation elongation factor [Geoalkalibacter sp.]
MNKPVSPSERHVIIGTAGHVDHGKTALIRALTGVETDRLKEEKARGISIDLGFAPFRLPGGLVAGVVDVPGHERFISNMLSGIGGIDLVLLVVDVNEGVMPQTREHLQILDLLRIPRGIIVLTKCDLAEEEWIDIVEEEIREEVAGTFLEAAPLARVSSVTGAGLKELAALIEKTVHSLPVKDTDGPMRLPIDRHFTVAGFGTVITGTLLSGRVRPGDQVEVLPPGLGVRVREVQVHGKPVAEASAGQRVALNLAGLDRELIRRGAVVATPGVFEQTTCVDARLSLLAEAPRPLRFRDPVHLYLGTARVVGLVALLDRDLMQPGESVIAQIHLDRPLVAHREDRFIVRSYSPMTTIGGGRVLDPKPTKHRRFRADIMAGLKELESGEKSFLLQKLGEQQATTAKNLELLAGLSKERVETHLRQLEEEGLAWQLVDQWATSDALASWRHRLIEAATRFHEANPLLPGIPHATLKGALPDKLSAKAFQKLLQILLDDAQLVQKSEWLQLPGWQPKPSPRQAELLRKIEEAYREEGVLAKNRKEMLDRLGVSDEEADVLLAYLFAEGRLVKLNEESFLHAEAYARALALLKTHFDTQQTLTLAQFRDLLGSARKQVQALLEHYDGLKFTRRVGDERVAWKLPAG